MELLIVSIICGLLLAISLGKMAYWRGQAKFYRMMRDSAMEHADGLSNQVRKQSEYIKKLRAEIEECSVPINRSPSRHEQIFKHELNRRPLENFVPVSDSAHVPHEYPPKYPDGHHYIHTWDGNKVKVEEKHQEGENHE